MHFDTALYTVVGASVSNVHFYVCCFISDGFSIFGSQEDSESFFLDEISSKKSSVSA